MAEGEKSEEPFDMNVAVKRIVEALEVIAANRAMLKEMLVEAADEGSWWTADEADHLRKALDLVGKWAEQPSFFRYIRAGIR